MVASTRARRGRVAGELAVARVPRNQIRDRRDAAVGLAEHGAGDTVEDSHRFLSEDRRRDRRPVAELSPGAGNGWFGRGVGGVDASSTRLVGRLGPGCSTRWRTCSPPPTAPPGTRSVAAHGSRFNVISNPASFLSESTGPLRCQM